MGVHADEDVGEDEGANGAVTQSKAAYDVDVGANGAVEADNASLYRQSASADSAAVVPDSQPESKVHTQLRSAFDSSVSKEVGN